MQSASNTEKSTTKRNEGKLQKGEFERENQKYYKSVKCKPKLYLEVSELNTPFCQLNIRNAIVLSIFERYRMAEWIDINILYLPNDKCVTEGLVDSNDKLESYIETNDMNDDCDVAYDDEGLNVLVQYESFNGFEKGTLLKENSVESDVGHVGTIKQPSIVVSEKRLIISGLSSVLRFLLKFCSMRIKNQMTTEQNNENLRRLEPLLQQLQNLMGFRSGCLQSCAETSMWTKFCEVDIIRMVVRILVKVANSTLSSKWEIAKDLTRFEYHLSQPVRIHNFRKRVQAENHKLQQQQQIHVESNNKEEASDLSHSFAEGPDMTLSDLILYHCVKITVDFYGKNIFAKYLPKTLTWYETVHAYFHSNKAGTISMIRFERSSIEFIGCDSTAEISIPEVPFESLYKTDPSRYKSKLRLYTRQEDIDKALEIVFSATKIFEVENTASSFDWSKVPKLAQPEGGKLPENRKDRKCHQLASLVEEVLVMYNEKMKLRATTGEPVKIVDFCSGGGHLGILLAWLLPQSQVILVENKEDSVRRAEERVDLLGLTNVFLQQSNLHYFDGQFDIGIALHACGTATDLVLQKCIATRACFVCCPCCYGAIQSNHMLHYPRSTTFHRNNISLRNYFVLGHSADQTHEKSAKVEQGKMCMRIVDTDRLLYAQEQGYKVTLKRMVPETASPKNHILVGVYAAPDNPIIIQ